MDTRGGARGGGAEEVLSVAGVYGEVAAVGVQELVAAAAHRWRMPERSSKTATWLSGRTPTVRIAEHSLANMAAQCSAVGSSAVMLALMSIGAESTCAVALPSFQLSRCCADAPASR